MCDCTHEENIIFLGFTQNGRYGYQLQPLEILFGSSNGNNSCSFTKQDLNFKQAYLEVKCQQRLVTGKVSGGQPASSLSRLELSKHTGV